MKRIFTLLCAAMLAGQAWADDNFKVGDLYYSTWFGKAYVECENDADNYANNYSGLTTVTIPDKVEYDGDEYPVVGISREAFKNCTSLTTITFPNSLQQIEEAAFYGCSNLKSVVIPNSETNLRESIFQNCTSLESVTLPSSITEIPSAIFGGCTSLTTIEIPNTVTFIGNGAFSGSGLTSIEIPASVTEIASFAFQDCDGLETITIPATVEKVQSWVFRGCDNLTINCCVTSIPTTWSTYWNDNVDFNLGSCGGEQTWTVTVSANNSSYGSVSGGGTYANGSTVTITATPADGYKFVKWSNGLTSTTANIIVTSDTTIVAEFEAISTQKTWTVTLSANNSSYGSVSGGGAVKDSSTVIIEAIPYGGCAFVKWSNGLTSDKEAIFVTSDTTIVAEFKSTGNFNFEITSDSTVEIVQSFDFGSNVVIPETVEIEGKTYTITSIGYDSFAGCGWIESVIIPQTVTNIASWAFFCCVKLSSIVIPNSVISIGDTAFAQSGLTTVIMGDSVRNIGKYAFGRCNKLTSITIPNKVKSIEERTLYGCSSLTSVVIGESVKSIGNDAFSGCSSLTSLVIGESVKSIGDEAFYGCRSLTSLVIDESVKSIGDEAFNGCSSLASLVIGESVENVGEYAFCRCDSLSSVIIKGDVNLSYSELWIKKDGVQYRVKNKNTVSVDSDIWDDYDYSGDIIIPATVIAGDTFYVKSIASYAFNYDSITSITIPKSVTEIGEGAFSHCRCLTSITIPNSVVSIGGWVFPNCSSLTEINVESGNTEYVSVDGVLFNKDKTILISYPAGKTGEYTIPNTVKEIATHAFSGCNDSTTVIIPKTVRTIDYYAFYDCAATINCMVNEKPDDWDTGWRGYDNFKGDVIWGYKPTPVTETAANAINIYAHGNTIVVENATDEISVYDAMGRLVGRDAIHRVRAELQVNTAGLYIVKVGTVAKRVMVNE